MQQDLYKLWGSHILPADLEERYRVAQQRDPISPGRAAWSALRGYILSQGGQIRVGEDDLHRLVRIAKSWSP
jgi:hypothetical protein